jgi:DNA-binding MarR family transcriptional regulator
MTSSQVNLDSLADMLGFQLRRAAAAVQSVHEADLARLGLCVSEARLLLGLWESPGSTQTELGRDLRIKPANIVPIVRRLEQAGLIERATEGRRSIALHLTGQGKKQVAQLRKILLKQEEQIIRQVPEADREKLLTALKAIAQHHCRDGG